jgi:DNA-binding Lrp family transcriptional regulator
VKQDKKPTPKLDDLDGEILNRVQKSIPVTKRPFKVIGEQLSIPEEEVVRRMQHMRDMGIIRRLGPILDYPAWGMSGLLVAAKVAEQDVELARQVLEDYPEITHAYIRKHEWNLWFTVIAENRDVRDEIIQRVSKKAHLFDVRKLPKKKTFKLGVKFEL